MSKVFYNETGGQYGGAVFPGTFPDPIRKYCNSIVVPEGGSFELTTAQVKLGTIQVSSFSGTTTAHIYSTYTPSSPNRPNVSIHAADDGVVLSGDNDRETRTFTFSDAVLTAGEYWFVLEFSATGSGSITFEGENGETGYYSEDEIAANSMRGPYYKNAGSWSITTDSCFLWFNLQGTYSGPSVPSAPINPTPADNATGITLDDTILTWEDGGGGETYDVYFRPYGEFYEKIASDITDLSFDAIVAHTPAYNGHYSYGQKYLWIVIAKNEYGASGDPPDGFTPGDGDVEWQFNAVVFDPPLPTGVTLDDDGTPTGESGMITVRRLVAAANQRIWYEEL